MNFREKDTRGINERISSLEEPAKSVFAFRMMLKVLDQYKSALVEDKLLERIPHLENFISETRKAGNR